MRLKSSAVTAALVAAAIAAPVAQASPIQDPAVGDSTVAVQDLRSPDARDAADRAARVPGPPTWPVDPQPIASVKAEPATDDGFPWEAVTLALAAAGLTLTGAAFVAGRRRRSRRTGVAV
jgi:hypothetical protein